MSVHACTCSYMPVYFCICGHVGWCIVCFWWQSEIPCLSFQHWEYSDNTSPPWSLILGGRWVSLTAKLDLVTLRTCELLEALRLFPEDTWVIPRALTWPEFKTDTHPRLVSPVNWALSSSLNELNPSQGAGDNGRRRLSFPRCASVRRRPQGGREPGGD